jgi:LPXTG-site transpeptidase (sortase) family protein
MDIRRLNTRRNISLIFVIIGALLLGYVSHEYFSMYSAQKRLAKMWQEQNRSAAAHLTKTDATAPDVVLTRISVPKIDMDAMVVEGASWQDLKIGPGRIKTTAVPGEKGNSVITGHRDTFFRHIYELNNGDDILVRRNGMVYRYQVTGKKIVQPDDVSVLKQTPDAQLTLITCYPTYYIGPAPERLVVMSKLVDQSPEHESDMRAENSASGTAAH